MCALFKDIKGTQQPVTEASQTERTSVYLLFSYFGSCWKRYIYVYYTLSGLPPPPHNI